MGSAALLKAALRETDSVRRSGEEFAIFIFQYQILACLRSF